MLFFLYRGFEFNLTKKSVYPYYLMEDLSEQQGRTRPVAFDSWFDKERKVKKRGKWKKLAKPREGVRGVHTVREHYKIDESKLTMERHVNFKVDYERIAAFV